MNGCNMVATDGTFEGATDGTLNFMRYEEDY